MKINHSLDYNCFISNITVTLDGGVRHDKMHELVSLARGGFWINREAFGLKKKVNQKQIHREKFKFDGKSNLYWSNCIDIGNVFSLEKINNICLFWSFWIYENTLFLWKNLEIKNRRYSTCLLGIIHIYKLHLKFIGLCINMSVVHFWYLKCVWWFIYF